MQNDTRNKVVIAGVGIVNPLGNSSDEILYNIEHGNRGSFEKHDKSEVYCGRVKSSNILIDNERKKMDRFTAMAIETASQIDFANDDKENMSVFMGTCMGGIDFAEKEIKVFYDKGARSVSPYLAISMFYSSNVAQIAIFNEIHGQLSLFSDGAIASASAICWAFEFIRNNMATTVIAGGSEAPTTELGMKAFMDMGILEDNSIISEGCGLLLLENEKTANRLNKKILGEIVGYGEGWFGKDEKIADNISGAIVSCLKNSNMSVEAIDAIVLNNDNIFENSEYEFRSIRDLFMNTNAIYLFMKHLIGYSFGAGLAQEIVLILACLEKEMMPEAFILNNKVLSSDKEKLNMRKNILNVLFVNVDIYGKSIALIVRRQKK